MSPHHSRVLFATPVTPRPSGTGSIQRAYRVLRALARRHEVHVVVADTLNDIATPPPETLAHCASFTRSPPLRRIDALSALRWVYRRYGDHLHPRWLTERIAQRALNAPHPWPDDRAIALAAPFLDDLPDVDRIHVFRLFTVPVFAALIEARPHVPLDLDLDDIESRAHHRHADLHLRRGERAAASVARGMAVRLERYEARWVPRCDRVYVCSMADRAHVERRFGASDVRVLPNTIAPIDPPPTRNVPAPGRPLQLLLIGAMAYFPNVDGLCWFLDQVWPKLSPLIAPRGAHLHIVGTGMTARTQRHVDAAAAAACTVHGWVDDLRPHYANADAVIAPIRTGGGTRIKILEALAHRRPVVTTSIGAEGLDVAHDEHVLVADTPDAFAAACARLYADPDAADRIAGAGAALVSTRYTDASLDAPLAPEPPSPRQRTRRANT